MNILNGLFQANGNQQTDDDRGDVDKEVSPGSGRMLRNVDIKHRGSLFTV
ncbi:hypothetical protein [Rhodanobacter sp. BL-MT-08]